MLDGLQVGDDVRVAIVGTINIFATNYAEAYQYLANPVAVITKVGNNSYSVSAAGDADGNILLMSGNNLVSSGLSVSSGDMLADVVQAMMSALGTMDGYSYSATAGAELTTSVGYAFTPGPATITEARIGNTLLSTDSTLTQGFDSGQTNIYVRAVGLTSSVYLIDNDGNRYNLFSCVPSVNSNYNMWGSVTLNTSASPYRLMQDGTQYGAAIDIADSPVVTP